MDSYISSWQSDESFLRAFKEFDYIVNTNHEPNPIDTALYARLYILRQLAKQQQSKNKNFVECGVFAGMSMFFMAEFCNGNFVGIDSFDGVSDPGIYDTDYFNNVKLKIDMRFAQNVLKQYKNISLYKGWIPDVFKDISDIDYSLVHIDVDLYEPTKNSIEHFWPKLVNGGVLICDDFGSSKTIGARKAMIDFFGRDNILELPTGQGIVYKNEQF